MIVDGKALAQELKRGLENEVRVLQKPLRLAAILIGENPASLSYVKRKQAFGRDVGVDVTIFRPEEKVWRSRSLLRSYLSEVVHDDANTGIIIQLPLPELHKARAQYFLDSVIPEKDVDVLSSYAYGKFTKGQSVIYPTMVSVIALILERYGVELRGRRIVVVGAGGSLVGRPICDWLLSKDLPFDAITRDTPQEAFREKIGKADVILSGVGKAGLITADMVKDGVVALDAGTSGASGQLKGDLDPKIEKKASFFTPVPGGIGPLTVFMLFKNLVILAKQK